MNRKIKEMAMYPDNLFMINYVYHGSNKFLFIRAKIVGIYACNGSV